MEERKFIARELDGIEAELKELQIRYEQYFAGVEKREPMTDRKNLATRLRRFVNRRIIQSDLRFRHQTLATRFHTYASYWDRILRLIDEGRYVRQQVRQPPAPPSTGGAKKPPEDVEKVYRELVAAQRSCRLAGETPDRKQLASFLEKQRERIREKFGDREVEFQVVTEGGKPKIKVRARS